MVSIIVIKHERKSYGNGSYIFEWLINKTSVILTYRKTTLCVFKSIKNISKQREIGRTSTTGIRVEYVITSHIKQGT